MRRFFETAGFLSRGFGHAGNMGGVPRNGKGGVASGAVQSAAPDRRVSGGDGVQGPTASGNSHDPDNTPVRRSHCARIAAIPTASGHARRADRCVRDGIYRRPGRTRHDDPRPVPRSGRCRQFRLAQGFSRHGGAPASIDGVLFRAGLAGQSRCGERHNDQLRQCAAAAPGG